MNACPVAWARLMQQLATRTALLQIAEIYARMAVGVQKSTP